GGAFNSLAVHGTMLFAATDSGLYRTSDLGESWVRRNPDSLRYPVHSVTVIGNDIYASGTQYNEYRSTDDGNTWKRIDYNPMYSIVTDGSYLYGAKNKSQFISDDGYGVLRSTDGGITWSIA